MKSRYFFNKYIKFNMMQWECCDELYELLLSRRFPDRYNRKPYCIHCGKVGLSWNELKNMDVKPFYWKSNLRGEYNV